MIREYLNEKLFQKKQQEEEQQKKIEYPKTKYESKQLEQEIYRYKIKAKFLDEKIEIWHDSFSEINLKNLDKLKPATIKYEDAEVPENKLYLFSYGKYITIDCPIEEDDDYLVNLNNASELEFVKKIKIVLEAEAIYELEIDEKGREEIIGLDKVVQEPKVVEKKQL